MTLLLLVSSSRLLDNLFPFFLEGISKVSCYKDSSSDKNVIVESRYGEKVMAETAVREDDVEGLKPSLQKLTLIDVMINPDPASGAERFAWRVLSVLYTDPKQIGPARRISLRQMPDLGLS
jgi:hypothetical protein